jgi:hypothetical protein
MLDYIVLVFVFAENKRRGREAGMKWSTGGGPDNTVHQVITITHEQTRPLTFSCMSVRRSWTLPSRDQRYHT